MDWMQGMGEKEDSKIWPRFLVKKLSRWWFSKIRKTFGRIVFYYCYCLYLPFFFVTLLRFTLKCQLNNQMEIGLEVWCKSLELGRVRVGRIKWKVVSVLVIRKAMWINQISKAEGLAMQKRTHVGSWGTSVSSHLP